jgi:hypothetical protein
MSKLTHAQRAFNSTREGQIALCNQAAEIAVALSLSRAIKSKGGVGWDDSFISSANSTLLEAIKGDLVREWNALVTKSVKSD